MQLLTTEQAAKVLAVSPILLKRSRRAENHVPGPPWVRVGKRCVRYKLDDLMNWLDSRREMAH